MTSTIINKQNYMRVADLPKPTRDKLTIREDPRFCWAYISNAKLTYFRKEG